MSKELFKSFLSKEKIRIINDKWCSFVCDSCGGIILTRILKISKNRYDTIYENHDKKLLCGKCGREYTCLKKYGVKNGGGTKESLEKIKKTTKERYGVDYYTQTKEYQEKTKRTCLEKYGTEHHLKSKDVIEKRKNNLMDSYGVENVFQLNNVKDKCKQTLLEKYGVEHNSQMQEYKEQVKKTCLERYGKENYFQTDAFKEKSKQVNLGRYGVEYFAQSVLATKYHRNTYLYDNLTFDSSWELAYYIYCVDFQIPIEAHPCSIPYSVGDKVHYYQPDFLINNSDLIEIKGEQFFNEKNELINPYDNSKETTQKNFAKQKCMQENNVKILRKIDLKTIFDYIDEHYGKDYLKRFSKKNNYIDI